MVEITDSLCLAVHISIVLQIPLIITSIVRTQPSIVNPMNFLKLMFLVIIRHFLYQLFEVAYVVNIIGFVTVMMVLFLLMMIT